MKRVAANHGVEVVIIHTGQHYDQNMAEIFFDQFGLRPDIYLNVSPAVPEATTGAILTELTVCLKELSPDLVIVPGDVNSTLAGALAAQALKLPLAHLESGLRSGDRSMPEEINRILTDEISDYYFVTEDSGMQHLLKEGKAKDQIHFVGNTMIDTMVAFDEEINASQILSKYSLTAEDFVLLTFHRPALVDEKKGLVSLTQILQSIPLPKVLPLHPRTKKNLERFGLMQEWEKMESLVLTGPMGYFDFQKLIKESAWVLTDSGGIQEETTFRQVPCITLRPNTERPSTIEIGSNVLVDPEDMEGLMKAIADRLNDVTAQKGVPPLWDGKATERIFEVLSQLD